MKTKVLLSLTLALFTYLGFAQQTHNITLSGTSFSNPNLTINVGDKVIWEVLSGTHTVTEGSNCTKSGFDSGFLSVGDKFEQTFTSAGEVNYFCIPHCSMGMTAKITVNSTTTESVNSKSAVAELKTYPNPFMQNSSVEFHLNTAGKVKAEVYDMKGNKFVETAESVLAEGVQTINIPGDGLKDGIYVCKIYFNGQITAAEYMVKVSK